MHASGRCEAGAGSAIVGAIRGAPAPATAAAPREDQEGSPSAPCPVAAREGATAMTLAGQTAIVTGGGSGIGQVICEALGAAGVAVVVADLDAARAEATAAAIRGGDGRAVAVPTDVADPGSVQQLVARAVAEYGAVDALVHCAGIT